MLKIKKLNESLNHFKFNLIESIDNDVVELYYNDLSFEMECGSYRFDRGYSDCVNVTTDFSYEVDSDEIIEALGEILANDEQLKELEDEEYYNYLEENFDTLVDKYYDELLDYFEDEAIEKAQDKIDPSDYMGEPDYDDYYDDWDD